MSDGALRISILGDASQFTKTLAQLQAELEDFQQKLKNATGADIPTYNLKIVGAQQSIKEITEFGKFAEGTLGRLIQLQKELESKRLTISDPSELAQVNQKLAETANLIKEIKATGIEKPISIPIQPPPPGSIADIKKQIAELTKEREIAIGPDLTYANYKINQLKGILDGLLKRGIEIPVDPIPPVLENSIQGIKNQIDELNRKKVLIDIANEGEIAQVNQQLDGLATKLARANSISFDKNGAISANAGKSRQALTSLSLVAQDLPFGFIAIQNNLPAVISSFGALSASAITTKGVLLSLRTALIGPAGIFLAFSVITAGITYAIQKYGSIGEAVDRLTGKYVELGSVVKKAAESLKQYNENLVTSSEISTSAQASQAGQILKARTLSAVVLDVSKSEKVRKNALQQLQKLDEPRFKNFSVEKGLLDGLSDSVKDYTRAIIAQAVAQKFTDQVTTTTVELEKQRNALGNVLTQLDKYKNFQERLNKLAQEQAATARQGGVPRSANKEEREIQALVDKRKELEAGIVSLATQLNEYNLSAQTATETASSLASAIENTGDKAPPAAKKIKGLKEELQKVVPLFDLLGNVDATQKDELKLFDFDINKEFVEQFLSENDINKLKKIQAERIRKVLDLRKFKKENLDPNLPNAEPVFTPSAEYNAKLLDQKKLAKDFEDTKLILEEVFFAPLSDLFANFFDTGKFAFEEFGKAILNTIKSIVSKIIATGIINLLANILLPGGGIASAALNGTATGAGGGIIGAFKAAINSVLGIGKISNPNFGGVQGGGMQLAGEVVFRQRGSDLIGVINRTNGTINRVG